MSTHSFLDQINISYQTKELIQTFYKSWGVDFSDMSQTSSHREQLAKGIRKHLLAALPTTEKVPSVFPVLDQNGIVRFVRYFKTAAATGAWQLRIVEIVEPSGQAVARESYDIYCDRIEFWLTHIQWLSCKMEERARRAISQNLAQIFDAIARELAESKLLRRYFYKLELGLYTGR